MKSPEVFLLFIPGPPQGKARPTVGRFKTKAGREVATLRTPTKTVNYEARISMAWEVAYPNQPPIEGPVSLDVWALFPLPDSRAGKIRTNIRAIEKLTKGGEHAGSESVKGRIRSMQLASAKTSRPDWDNVGKAVCDALNGIAWGDDAQVVDGRVRKKYIEAPEIPGLRIVIRPVA